MWERKALPRPSPGPMLFWRLKKKVADWPTGLSVFRALLGPPVKKGGQGNYRDLASVFRSLAESMLFSGLNGNPTTKELRGWLGAAKRTYGCLFSTGVAFVGWVLRRTNKKAAEGVSAGLIMSVELGFLTVASSGTEMIYFKEGPPNELIRS